MKSKIKKYEEFVLKCKAEKTLLKDQIEKLSTDLISLNSRIQTLNEAITVINIVGVVTSDDSKAVIEGVVTEALQIVYDDSYSFIINNTIQRGQPESNLFVKKGDHLHSLRDEEVGGGVADVASFALRVTMWAICDPKTNNVMILDEPLKNLDSERLSRMGTMIKKLSDNLGLQFLIVTHEPQLSEIADRTFFVKKANGLSIVEVV